MQSKCNKYNRQQSEQYVWKTVDRWTWCSRCDHRKVQLKNGRPTIDLAQYIHFILFIRFSPQLEYPLLSIAHLLHLVSFSVHSFTDCGFAVAKSYAPAEPSKPLEHLTQLMTNKEKNIISLRSLTAALQLLEKKQLKKDEPIRHIHYSQLISRLIASPTRTRVSRVLKGIIQPDNLL